MSRGNDKAEVKVEEKGTTRKGKSYFFTQSRYPEQGLGGKSERKNNTRVYRKVISRHFAHKLKNIGRSWADRFATMFKSGMYLFEYFIMQNFQFRNCMHVRFN